MIVKTAIMLTDKKCILECLPSPTIAIVYSQTSLRDFHQVAANVIIGRSHLGVHYRMDGVYGAEMGEAGAIRRLQQV